MYTVKKRNCNKTLNNEKNKTPGNLLPSPTSFTCTDGRTVRKDIRLHMPLTQCGKAGSLQNFQQIIIWVYTESLVEAYKQSASTILYITKPELRAFLQASFTTAQYLSFTVRSGEVVIVRQESGMNAEHAGPPYWLGWFFTESRLREKG